MTYNEIKTAIKKEEGLRLDAYPDSRGYLTIGYGHLLKKGSKIPLAAAELIFDADFEQAVADYLKLKLSLDATRQAAIIDMLFNMGLSRFMSFKRFLAALRRQDWQEAAKELMDSEYACQVPNRAARNRDRILMGG